MAKIKKIILTIIGLSLLFTPGILLALEISYPPVMGQSLNEKTDLPAFALYLFNLGTFIGFCAVFFSLVVSGAMYALSVAKPDLQSQAKDRVFGSLSGLLILVLSYLIITTINPQLSFLHVAPPPKNEPTDKEKVMPGVYLYTDSKCPPVEKIAPSYESLGNLQERKNKVRGVKIIQETESYFTILYDELNFSGACQYIIDGSGQDAGKCETVSPFAISASIHIYNPKPNGKSIYFFRKPCFNTKNYTDVNDIIEECKKNGGYKEITNDEIMQSVTGNVIFTKDLNSLYFEDVPQNEMDCKSRYPNGQCSNLMAPSLGGENISSIIINGNYLVLLVYYKQADSEKNQNIWQSCQEFPNVYDVNKFGPRQIKWENIRNTKGIVPNTLMIFPIKQQ